MSKTPPKTKPLDRRSRRREFAIELLETRLLLDADPINAPLSSAQRQSIISGLNDVASWASSLANTGQFATVLPLANQSIGQSANVGNMLTAGVVSYLDATSQSATNTDQFVDAIEGLSRTAGELTIAVNPTSVTGGLVVDGPRTELQFTADFQVTRLTNLNSKVDFGSSVANVGLSIDAELPIPIASQLSIAMTFGLDLTPGLTNDQSFFIRPTSLSLGTSVDTNSLAAPSKVGLLATQLIGGTIDMDARLNVALVNPDLDPLGNITLEELKGTAVNAIASQTVSMSSLAGSLPVAATLGSQTFNAASLGTTPTLSIASGNVFGGTAFITATPNTSFSELQNFNNLRLDSLLKALERTGHALQDLSEEMDINGNFGGFGYTNTLTSDVVDLESTFKVLSRTLYEPTVNGSVPMALGSGFSLANNAEFTVQINESEIVDVVVPRQIQGNQEPIATFIQRLLPASINARITAFTTTDSAGQSFFAFRAVDPDITKFKILINDYNNSAVTNLGLSPGASSVQAFKYDTIQSFSALLAQSTSLVSVDPSYDIVSNQLSFRTRVLGAPQTADVPLDFTSGLGPATYTRPATGTFSVTPTFDGRVAIGLDQLPTQLIATGDAPANGQLSGLATLSIKLNGAAAIQVHIPHDTTNSNIDDLVVDINAALRQTGLNQKVYAGRSGDRLTLSSSTASSMVVEAESGNPGVTELKLVGAGVSTRWDRVVSVASGGQLQLSTQVTSSNLTGNAAIGILPVTITTGTLNIAANTGVQLNRQLALYEMDSPEPADVQLAIPTTTLAGNFVTSVPGALGVTSSNPASFGLTLTTPNQWETRLVALADAPVNGRLPSDATMQIRWGQGAPVDVVVAVDNTNQNIDDLVFDINQAIRNTRLEGNVVAQRQGNRIALVADSFYALSVDSLIGDPADITLRLRGTSAASAIATTMNTVFAQRVAPIQSFQLEDFIGSVQGIVDLFEQDRLRSLTSDIPLIDKSLDDVLGVSQRLKNSIVDLQAKEGLSLKLAMQGVVNNLNNAIATLPQDLAEDRTSELFDLFTKLRVASLNAERTDVPLIVDLASVVVASLSGYSSAIAKINQPGIDMVPFNNVQTQLANVTPSLLQLGSSFAAGLGVGTTNSGFANARPSGFEQALIISTTWNQPVVQALPLTILELPGELGPLIFDSPSSVTVNATRDFRFDFGFNFSTETAFLQDTSRFNATATLSVGSSSNPGNVGGVAVSIGHPTDPAIISARTNVNTAPALFNNTLNQTPTSDDIGNIPFPSVPGSMNYSQVNANLVATLPVYITGNDRGNITVNWPVPSLAAAVEPTVTVPADLIPTLESQPYDFSLLTEGIEAFNERLKNLVRDSILAQFPLVADGVNIDAGFISRLETQFYSAVVNAITANGSIDSSQLRADLFDGIETALGPMLVAETLQVTSSGSPEVRFRIAGSDEYTGTFDAGLPGLNMEFDNVGTVNIEVDYDLAIGFGLSQTAGFYFIVQRDPAEPTGPQFKFDISATLAASTTAMPTQMMALPVTATPVLDNAGQSLTRVATARVNGTFIDSDNRLSINQVDSSLFSDELDIVFGDGGASSTISLALQANALDAITGDPDMPDFGTDLLVTQTFAAGVELNDPGSIPQVRFNNIGIGLGQTLSRMLEPILEQAEEYLEIVRPVIRALNEEVPVLSDLARFVGAEPITWLEALQIYSDNPDIGEVVTTILDVIEIIETIDEVIEQLQTMTTGARLVFGDYIFNATFDLRIPRPEGIEPFTSGIFVPNPDFTTTNDGTVSPAVGNADPAVANLMNNDLRGDGWRFPIFENPRNIISILFGRDITFVTWDIPPFEVEIETPDLYLFTVPVPTPVGVIPVNVYGSILYEVGVNVGMGFDSRGFRQDQDFLDGFFFRDRGFNQPPVVSTGPGIRLTGEVGIPLVASIGIEGTLTANLEARWNNFDRNGRYHLDELLENAAIGPECIMALGGSIDVSADIVINLLLTPEINIPILPETSIFSWGDYVCAPLNPELATIATQVFPLVDFESGLIAPGTLVLNIGPYAGRRNPGNTPDFSDNHERIEVKQIGNGIFEVSGFGETKVYGSILEPITAIYGDGGNGKNTIIIDNSVTVPTTLIGGITVDELRGGSGPNRIIGRGGRDLLYGGIADDFIQAGGSEYFPNQAQIFGGPGNDTIVALDGINFIDGEDGDDIIQGGYESDQIYGGRGDDQISGGGGTDRLFGEEGNDIIIGQGDEGVYIEGGRGNNLIYGSNGRDLIYASLPAALPGESGMNTVFARDGDDIVYGGPDNTNEIHGGADNDILYGGDAADLILAGSGTDLVLGYGGDDIIFADSGNNTIYGGTGDDLIYGSSGATRPANWPSANPPGFDGTYAGNGLDMIFGESGNDTIYGGVGTGTIDGGSHSDFIFGGTGDQFLRGGTGDDIIRTGDGDQAHFGDAGNDLLEQSVALSQILTDETLAGRGNQTYASFERILLANPSNSANVTFDVSNFQGAATLVGSSSMNDIVLAAVDADMVLSDGNLSTSRGASLSLQGITRATLRGIQLDNTFDVSLWSGTASLIGGTGEDRVLSVRDSDYVLTDTTLTRSLGGTITLSGIRAATLAGGPSNNTLNATNYSGSAWLYGAGGDDVLRGGSGDDFMDGGTGNNTYYGNGGADVIDATAGNAATIFGGGGDDVIYGSDFGDTISAGAGNDRVYSRGGNDTVKGGAGDDILDGGAGDDTLSGDAGTDVLLGGSGNDMLYAFNLAGIGDDGAVNYLYGDFGTSGDEPGAGNDILHAGLGNDLSFGESGTNTFSGGGTGAVVHDGVAAGLRPTTPPAEPPIPRPANWPPISFGDTLTLNTSGTTYYGRWTDLSGSGTGRGISQSPGIASSPSIAVSSAGPWVSWIDTRSGSPQVYVALHSVAGWQELAGSASGGGISGGLIGFAQSPAIAIDGTGLPIVAWTQVNGTNRNVNVARYDATANSGAGGWVALGTSLSVGGISGTNQASSVSVVMTSTGPVVAWLESNANINNIYAKRFEGGSWIALGTTGASGTGISASTTSVSNFAIASDGIDVSVAWTQPINDRTQIYARSFNGTAWNTLGNSVAGNGVSGTTGSASRPSLAYHAGGQLFVAWQDTSSNFSEIYAAQFDGVQWIDAGIDSRIAGGVSNTRGSASSPKLSTVDEAMSLVWQDDRRAAGKGNSTALYAKRWSTNQFVEELPGDARDRGITNLVGSPGTHAVALDGAGNPFVVWSDTVSGKSEIYLQLNRFVLGTIHYVNDVEMNDNARASNSYTTAIGRDSNDGLTPATPKLSLSSVLNDPLRPLNVGDVILLDAGSHTGATVTGSQHDGILILGPVDEPATLATPLNITSVDRVIVSNLRTTAGISVTDATRTILQGNELHDTGISVSGGSESIIFGNRVQDANTGVAIRGDSQSLSVYSNTIQDGSRGIVLGRGATTQAANGVTIRSNKIVGANTSLLVEAPAIGRIENNHFDDAITAVQLNVTFAGLIKNNRIDNSGTGVHYAAANTLDNNLIYGNNIGVHSSVATLQDALGYFGTFNSNRVVNNTTGIQLAQGAVVQGQYVWGNSTGITGDGSVVASSMSKANSIGSNNVGVHVTGPVQFNQLERNATGVATVNRQQISHNEFIDNSVGLDIAGDSDVRVFSNTFVGSNGTHVQLTSSANQIELRNNIFWTDSGYNIFVDNSSTTGFFSDFNTLTAGPNGKLVYWTRDFNDILDWQEDVNLFDRNSSGTTVVNPRLADPRFLSRSLRDLRVFDQSAQLRFTSPTIDAGDPSADEARATVAVNLLNNPSFENGTTGWSVSPATSNIATNPSIAYDGTSYFRAGNSATTILEQTIDLLSAGFLPANVDALQYSVDFGARLRSVSEAIVDRATLEIVFLDGNNNTIGSPLTYVSANTTDRWHWIGDRSYVPALTRRIRIQIEAVRSTGATNDVWVDSAIVSLSNRGAGVDTGANGNSSLDSNAAPHLRIVSPDLYKDWELNKPIDIRWDSFGNTADSAVVIRLLQDTAAGPQLLSTIASSTPDDGAFTWIAANSGLTYGTNGLRIEVSLLSNPTIRDRSSEPFTIPENSSDYFVNDASVTGDEWSSAVGSNRNTGRSAAAPKPDPNSILRLYTLGAGSTLTIDAGSYPLLSPLVISNLAGVNDDEGFVMQGASNRKTLLSHANPLTVANLMELNDADFMTINHLELIGGTTGLRVRNGSTNLNLDGVSSLNATQQGMLIDGGSTALTLTRLIVDGSQGPGLRIDVPLQSLTDSTIRNNRGTGLELNQPGGAIVEGNRIFNNTGNGALGVLISNATGAPVVFGTPNVVAGRGNVVHDNTAGIRAFGSVHIVGNTIYNHVGNHSFGVESFGVPVSLNVIYDNLVGIRAFGSTVNENRVYHKNQVGIYAVSGGQFERNVIYSNPIGFETPWGQGFAGSLSNNIVYANANAGVVIHRGNGTTLLNNTIVQASGDAVRLANLSANISLRNNNLWTTAGYALNVSTDSQTGFQSDYNNLLATGTGAIAFWQNIARPTLQTWQTTAFTDINSLSANPSFVNMNGVDGILGYTSNVNDGGDDDFHLLSQFGSYRGISFAPVATLDGTGAPVFLAAPGNPSISTTTSALIDRGSPVDSVGLEPAPNGGFINIGAYGGTVQASHSPTEYLTVFAPDGGEVLPQGQTRDIRWRTISANPTPTTVTIELLDGIASVLTISNSAPNTGSFSWTIPESIAPGSNYRIRIARNDITTSVDTSNAPFSIVQPISVYYVNDGTVQAGDDTTAIGDNANSGLSPSAPKASISAILAAYTLNAGDVIQVDAGVYNLSTALVLNSAASGITIRGYHNASFSDRSTIIDRGSSLFNAIELVNADDVTLDQLTIRNANAAVFANGTSDSDRLTISNSNFMNNAQQGVYLLTSNDFPSLFGNTFINAGNIAADINGTNALLAGNSVSHNGGFTGFNIRSQGAVIRDNTFSNIGTALRTENPSTAPTDRIVARDNTFSNVVTAISGNPNTAIINNIISNAQLGIIGYNEVTGNIVRDGNNGIQVFSGQVFDNRVFHNQGYGIAFHGNANNGGNRVYNNDVGIRTELSFSSALTNNFLVNNTTGILVNGSGYYGGTPSLMNNTIIQEAGDAIRVSSLNTQNVSVRNNILSVSGGYAINVDSVSNRGFKSDYNNIHLRETAKLGRWEGIDYTEPDDWFYDLGLDKNSVFGDPQFVDLDGADNVLGYAVGTGLTADYFANNSLSGLPFATRTETSLGFSVSTGSPIAGLPADNFSARWTGYLYFPSAGSYSFYGVADDGMRLYLNDSPTATIDQWNLAGYVEQTGTFTATGSGWIPFRLDYRELTGGALMSLQWSGPGFTKRAIHVESMNPTLMVNVGDYGADDQFTVSINSPTIDAGDPNDSYFREPLPNGARVNIGAGGHSSTAEISPLQSVQVASPNGREKYELGQTVPIQLRSDGLRTERPILLNPNLTFQIPVPDGEYSIRMHFIEGVATAAGTRRFDIKLNGATVRANYDIFAAAGARFKAVAESFSTTATNGTGLTIDLTRLTASAQAQIAAVEIFTANPLGIASPNLALDVSSNSGVDWTPIPGADAIPVDRWGNATYNWTIPANLPESNNYLIRTRSAASIGNLSDTSNSPFTIANAGNHYYVNDTSLANDVFATVTGSNAFSGKAPDQPMASLAALLHAYSFNPGDVIHVDAGLYQIVQTISLTSNHNGIRIEGPTTGSSVAVLNRTSTTSNIFSLVNADDVTFDSLTFQSGHTAISANIGADSDRITVSRSTFRNSNGDAISVLASNDQLRVEDSTFFSSFNTASIRSQSPDAIFTGNTFSSATTTRTGTGIDASGARSQILDNQFSTLNLGLSIGSDDIVIRNNTITNIEGIGIYGGGIIESNVIDGALHSGVVSIFGGQIRNNIVRNGLTGISSNANIKIVEGNRIYGNSGVGLDVGGAPTSNNYIYDNAIGIRSAFSGAGHISNNYIANNSTIGIQLDGGTPNVVNNTIIQPVGDAIQVVNLNTANVKIRNNILHVGSGYTYNVSPLSTRGFSTDYNLIHRTGTGKIARWENTDFNDPIDWFYEVGMDKNSIYAAPQFVDLDGPDNVFANGVGGFDDNFAIALTSPAGDAGDPNEQFAFEPLPNGGRVNLGAAGNSLRAEPSNPQALQVITPNGLEKFEQGQTVPVRVNTAGLRSDQPVYLINAGGASVDRWVTGIGYTSTGVQSFSNHPLVTATIDRSAVSDAPPESVYRTFTTAWTNPGNKVSLQLPTLPGTYSLRLHFIEGDVSTAGARRFDIRINGILVRANYDIFATAGAQFKAVAESFTDITVGENEAISIELTNLTGSPAVISAIEVFTDNSVGTTSPTVALDQSSDDGATWTPIAGAGAVPVDRYGVASFDWTVPNDATVSNNYRVRARASGNLGQVYDTSNSSFSVANNGLGYFISPSGDNRNSGKTPTEPMRSISGLVQAYDLDVGDVVEVIGGNHRSYRNIVLDSSDSGVRFFASPSNPATINRGNTSALMRGFEFTGAGGIVLDGLRVTGAEHGIFAVQNAGAHNNTITNCQLSGNLESGANIQAGNNNWQFINNKIFGLPGGVATDNQNYGIFYATGSTGHQIIGNEIYNQTITGIQNPGDGALIESNDIRGNSVGIVIQSGTVLQPSVIRKNRIHDNQSNGIQASGPVLITENSIFGHNGVGDIGINASGFAQVINNHIYENTIGARVFSSTTAGLPTTITGNYVYGNSQVGIEADAFANIDGNYIYSNSNGIQTTPSFFGNIQNNTIYSNTNRGLLIQNANNTSTANYLNNTIYQPVGDAVRLENAARNNTFSNNIIWVLAGFGFNVADNSQTGFQSNYNALSIGSDPSANTGYWNGAARKNLADWQTTTTRDLNSLSGLPSFVDIDGADNVLGYVTTPQGKINGGVDDNFYLSKNSTFIDRGSSWTASARDIEGFSRVDDPGTLNAGALRYAQTTESLSNFPTTGVAQNWRADNSFWQLNLPYSFPFYGTNYTSLWVSSNGFLGLGPLDFNAMGDPNNTEAKLLQYPRIAPLWDDLTTANAGDDIFVDSSITNETTIRWNATNKANNADTQFSVTIGSDGRIQFRYGAAVSDLTPTAGLSRGNRRDFEIATGIDSASTIAGLQLISFPLVPGIADIGAYEFRGSSLDNIAPTIVGSAPDAVILSGVTAQSLNTLRLDFSEEVNPIDARSPASYELRSAGMNNTFDDSDDIVYTLRPQYTPGQNSVQLVVGPPSGGENTVNLPIGRYRVTVLGTPSSSIYDLAGNRLDGDANGSAGGNFTRIFKVISNTAPILIGANALSSIDEDIPDHLNPGSPVQSLIVNNISNPDGPDSGIAVVGVDNANGFWEYTLDGVNYSPIAGQLTGGNVLLLSSIPTTRVRFRPNANLNGNAGGVSFLAWDQADELPNGTSVQPGLLSANSLSENAFASTIEVLPVNDPPSDLILSNSQVDEKLPVGTLVGQFTSVDIDSVAPFTYSLVDGPGSADNARFTLVGDQLFLAEVLDFEAQPSHSIRVRTTDNQGASHEQNFTVSVSNTPVRVTGLFVRGSGWSNSYLAMLANNGLGSTIGGFRLIDGAGQLSNSSLLTWQTINQVSVTFDEAPNLDPNALRILNGNDQDLVLSANGYSYDAATRTARWTLATPLTRGRYLLHLESAMIADGGGASLDAEWLTSADTYGTSGDGQAGGDLNFRFNYLPGDVTRNGQTNPGDVNALRSRGTIIPNATNYWMDVTGNNQINPGDVNFVRSLGTITLPASAPSIPPPPRGGNSLSSGSNPKQEDGHGKTDGAQRRASFPLTQSRPTHPTQELDKRSQLSANDIVISKLSVPIVQTRRESSARQTTYPDWSSIDQVFQATDDYVAELVLEDIDWNVWDQERRRTKK